MRQLQLALAATLVVLAGSASAQTGPAPGSGLAPAAPMAPSTPPAGSVGSTATGTMPDRTASTTAVGKTKPPGDVVGNQLGTRPDLEQKSREIDNKIKNGICSGCK